MNDFKIRKALYSDCFNLSLLKREIWETTYRGIYPDEKIDNYDYKKMKKNSKVSLITQINNYMLLQMIIILLVI